MSGPSRARPVRVAAPLDGRPIAGRSDGTTSLEVPYRVRFDESTPAGTVRTSALLRYAQDCAWAHSERLGYGRGWYAERGLYWLVRAVELRLLGTVETGALASVTTTVVGFRRVLARRRTAIVAPDGSPIASIETDWALVDDGGAPTRIPDEFSALLPAGNPTFSPHRVALPASAAEAAADDAPLRFAVRLQELDPMGHANNAVFLDWLEEAVVPVDPGLLDTIPRAYRLEYRLPARPGVSLEARAWRTGPWTAAYRLTDPGGELFRGIVET